MIFRFSLYGFLKNLRIFDAFLLLALLDRGLDFLAIGTLFSIREVTIIALEVPSGALADTLGRRRCMVASMLAYVLAGLGLWSADSFWWCAVSMCSYGVGEAFRSGTHKALIMAWLRQTGRLHEKTRIYGYTRSWSLVGSAISALGGGALLLAGFGYRIMFLVGAGIALLNLVNLATYPEELDELGEPSERGRLGLTGAYQHLAGTLRDVLSSGELRAILLAGVAVRGGYKVGSVYLQPVLGSVASERMGATPWSEPQRIGVLVGVVSALILLLSSFASRQAYRHEALYGGAQRCARALGLQLPIALLLLGAALWFEQPWLAVALFALLALGRNLWAPVQVSLLASMCVKERTATVLSIESQASALLAAVLAPIIGALVDQLAGGADPVPLFALVPVGLIALPLLAARLPKSVGSSSE